MGHHLEALVIPEAAVVLARAELQHTRAIALTRALYLVPIVDASFDALRERFPDASDPFYSEFWKLVGPVVLVAKRLSHTGAVAYIETDYFGGVGGQAAMVWRAGEVVMPAAKGKRGPVSAALRLLGAKAGRSNDEFDAVGLGRHRHTDDWLDAAPAAPTSI
jgi:hypothetical protein